MVATTTTKTPTGSASRVMPQNAAALIRSRTNIKYQPGKSRGKHNRLTFAQAFNLARRLAILAAAIYFVYIEFSATFKTVAVLRTTDTQQHSFGTYESKFIASYLGSGAIRDSPLLMEVLENDTAPRGKTLFLWSETNATYDACDVAKDGGYDFYTLWLGFALFQASTSYNLTLLSEIELITPIVDCSFDGLVDGDPSVSRVYNLVRSIADPDEVYFVSMLLSVQDYEIVEQMRAGPAFIGTLSLLSDMRATTVPQYYFMALDHPYKAVPVFYICEFLGIGSTGAWTLRSISPDETVYPPATVYTARRRGFYFNSESTQSNIAKMHWRIEKSDPVRAMTLWQWEGKPFMKDSWAWVHGIHFIFGVEMLSSLIVLFVIMARNWEQGKIWVGDAFASLSNRSLAARMILVLVSWHVNEYWVLTELALANGSKLSGSHTVSTHNEFVAADMFVLVFGLVGLVGWLANERIDPALVVVVVLIVHYNRLEVLQAVPAINEFITDYADSEYFSGIASVTPLEAKITKRRLWTTHLLSDVEARFTIAAALLPTFVIVAIISSYTLARKIYHKFYPDQVQHRSERSTGTNQSGNSQGEPIEKSHVTIFEIATGALLRSRFGLISDYNNYVIIKGLKFASADGIYCSGYVIANGKFLVATDDIFAIALIKLLRTRLYNVYVYEVEGNSVQQTARLVYPNTLTWKDLTHLNTSILS